MVRHSQSPQIAWRICQRVAISGTVRPHTKMGIDGTISQLTHCRPPRERQYPCPNCPTLLVAQDDYLGGMVHHGMCTLPTKQDTHHKEEDPPLSHPRGSIDVPIQCCRPRSHHPATQSQQTWCDSHSGRPGMLQSHYLPPMPYDNHWRRGSPLIPQKSIPVVRSPFKNNIRPWSAIHVPLCASTNHQAKHRMKH